MFQLSRRHALGLAGSVALVTHFSRPAFAASGADAAFEKLGKDALEGGFRLSPVYATYVGEHRYDGEIDDVSAAGRAAQSAFLKSMLTRLQAIDRSKLSRANQADALILENQFRFNLWDLETMQSWAWDPQGYNELNGSAIYLLLAREFAPLNERLMHAADRMEKLPAMLAIERQTLDPARVPAIHAETVAKQNKGTGALADAALAQAGGLPAADKARLASRRRQMESRHRRASDLARRHACAQREGRFPNWRRSVTTKSSNSL